MKGSRVGYRVWLNSLSLWERAGVRVSGKALSIGTSSGHYSNVNVPMYALRDCGTDQLVPSPLPVNSPSVATPAAKCVTFVSGGKIRGDLRVLLEQ